jgi:hypothetical protein
MLSISISELNYCRLLTQTLSEQEANALKARFDYIFAVCYDHCQAAGFDTVQKNACLIDLHKGLDHAFSKFNATSRNEVRRSEKIEGLTFQTGVPVDFNGYYDFYKSCENARGWHPVPASELRNSLIITAYFEEKPISGMSAYAHEGRLRISRIYSLKRRNDNPQLSDLVFGCAAKRIVYEWCQFAIHQGFQSLDLGGIDLQDPTKAGIAQFKLFLGGRPSPVIIARHASEKFKAQAAQIRQSGYDIT